MTDKDKICETKDLTTPRNATQAEKDTNGKMPDTDIQIINLYKNTMDNISMSQDKKDEIRAGLESLSHEGRRRHKAAKIARYAAIAAAVCAVLLCIPATRTTVSAAIDYIKQTFHLANGGEVTYEENSEGNSISFSITSDDDNGYTKVEGGRIYFVLGDTKEDITDKCSPDKYFRHEIKNADGTRSVILIGGTPESCGWVELFFDKNGKYIFNNMNVDDYNDPWLDRALNNEGVDSGNPYLDDQLSSDDYESGTHEISETSGNNSGMTGPASENRSDSSSDVSNDSSKSQANDTITSITIGNNNNSDAEASTSATYIQQ